MLSKIVIVIVDLKSEMFIQRKNPFQVQSPILNVFVTREDFELADILQNQRIASSHSQTQIKKMNFITVAIAFNFCPVYSIWDS